MDCWQRWFNKTLASPTPATDCPSDNAGCCPATCSLAELFIQMTMQIFRWMLDNFCTYFDPEAMLQYFERLLWLCGNNTCRAEMK